MSVPYSASLNMEDMEAGSGFCVFGFCVGRRQCMHSHASAEAERSIVSLCLSKRVYYTVLSLDLDDGFAFLAKSPSSFYVNRWGDSSFMTLARC